MKALLWLLPALVLPAAGLTVRVLPTPGGPQIHVDGQPVAPRFFWGSMSGGNIQIGEQWADYTFEFRPGIKVDGEGTLHFRFGHLAGRIDVTDVRVRDTQTSEDILAPGSFANAQAFARAWNTWPPAPANTVGKWELAGGALHVSLVEPPGGAWPDFHFYSQQSLSFRADHAYRCTFRARASPGRDIYPAIYRVANGAWTSIGGPAGPFLSQVALARDAGVNLVSFGAPECWGPPEKPNDWSPIDNLCRQIIASNRKVLLVPRVGVDAPDWWLRQHPKALMVYDLDQPGRKSCVSDRAYRADAAAHLEKLCRHLCQTFPNHFAGIHPCGQNTGEWFYEDSWLHPLSGYDPATLAAWRTWLKEQGDPGAQTAPVPSDAERRAHPFGLLRDPAREKRLIEFARFAAQNRKEWGLTKPETFDFLGFTHICGKTKDGRFWLRRITIKKRLRAKLKQVKTELRRRRQWPVREQGRWLASVLRGHFNYYAVPGNIDAISAFRDQVRWLWRDSLRRRSQRHRMTWERYAKIASRWLPSARIVRPHPSVAFAARTQGRSPVR